MCAVKIKYGKQVGCLPECEAFTLPYHQRGKKSQEPVLRGNEPLVYPQIRNEYLIHYATEVAQ